jgi:hypothetical protein
VTHGPETLRPLRHSSPSEPELVLGARLLAHTQPLGKSEARKRRVWNALSSGRSSRLGFRLSALHVAFASVLCAAVSSAAVGGYYVKHRAAEAAQIPAPAQPATHGKSRAAATARGPGHAPATPPEPLVTAPAAEATLAADADKSAATRPLTRAKPEAAVARRAASEADAELLVEAMRARRGGDAQRVSELVDEYRARHPQGALQEEALILSVESAVARHAPNASALAREYLRRFPSGRFALQARRALDSNAR